MPPQLSQKMPATGAILPNEPELIQCLYQWLHHQAGFHDFLAMLADAVNGCAAQLSFIRRSPRAIEHIWHAGLSDEFIGWYLDNNMIAHDAVTNHAITQQPGHFNSALPLIGKDVPGEDYARWESDHQMLDSAWMVVDASDTHIVLLTVQRTLAQGAYFPSELEAMNRLVPFVRQTVTLAETYHQHPDAGMIRDYFSLTNAEAGVCEDLIKGVSLKGIASSRHKSEATVRSNLKQVFLKTGQSRQGQLISTILSSLLR